jgi:hypothetical protein
MPDTASHVACPAVTSARTRAAESACSIRDNAWGSSPLAATVLSGRHLAYRR